MNTHRKLHPLHNKAGQFLLKPMGYPLGHTYSFLALLYLVGEGQKGKLALRNKKVTSCLTWEPMVREKLPLIKNFKTEKVMITK